MEYLNKILDIILNNFDFCYMLTVNLLTYFVIKLIDKINGNRVVSVLVKRLTLIGVIVISAGVYWSVNLLTVQILNSAVLAPVAYSWIFRPILIKLGVGYKDLDDCLLFKDAENESISK